MAFKFPLATVLKYREEIEKKEERALEQRREALTRAEFRLNETRQKRQNLICEREVVLVRGGLGDDLRHLSERQTMLERLEIELQKVVATARAEFEKQMQIFLVARQQREILDELKETQKEAWTEHQERREQAQIDEMFTARMKRNT